MKITVLCTFLTPISASLFYFLPFFHFVYLTKSSFPPILFLLYNKTEEKHITMSSSLWNHKLQVRSQYFLGILGSVSHFFLTVDWQSYLLFPWENGSNHKWTILSTPHNIYQWFCVCTNIFIFFLVTILSRIFSTLVHWIHHRYLCKNFASEINYSLSCAISLSFSSGLCLSLCKPMFLMVHQKWNEKCLKPPCLIIFLYFIVNLLKSVANSDCLLLTFSCDPNLCRLSSPQLHRTCTCHKRLPSLQTQRLS